MSRCLAAVPKLGSVSPRHRLIRRCFTIYLLQKWRRRIENKKGFGIETCFAVLLLPSHDRMSTELQATPPFKPKPDAAAGAVAAARQGPMTDGSGAGAQ